MSDASHWCKNVIETVVAPISNLDATPRYSVPPPQPPVKKPDKKLSALDLKVQALLGNNNPSPAASSSAPSSTTSAQSQYFQMYRKMYAPDAPSIPSAAAQSQFAAGAQPFSYKSALTQQPGQGGPSIGWSMQNLSRPATAMPQHAYGVTATATSYEAYQAAAPRLPSQPPPPLNTSQSQQPVEKRKKSNRFSPIDAKPNAFANPYTNPNSSTSADKYNSSSNTIEKKSPYQFSATDIMESKSKTGNIYGPGAGPVLGSPRNSNGTPKEHPASLKLFVKRAFAACSSDTDRSSIRKALQSLIARVTADGRLNVHKWELEPIPPLPSATSIPNSNGNGKSSRPESSRESNSREEYISFIDDTDTPNTKKRKKNRFSEAFVTEEKESLYSPRESSSSSKVVKSVLAGVATLNSDKQELQMRQKRANRFQSSAEEETPVIYFQDTDVNFGGKKGGKNGKKAKINIPTSSTNSIRSYEVTNDTGEFDMDKLKIVGTCSRLEKPYLRLTSAPPTSAVRPEAILRKSIQLLKKKWAGEQVDYEYMCSQLKSIRQDLTVQHIANEFTVHVYETHARVALESEDMNEYNQCQTQLKQLYAAGLNGCEMEFTAYRLLYYVYLLGNKKHTGGSSDLSALLSSLTASAREDNAVIHALAVRQAIQLDNYHKFFKLYSNTPNMGNCILDKIIDNYRLQSLQKIIKAYKPTVSASFVSNELAFDEYAVGVDIMKKCGCKFDKVPITTNDGSKGSVLEINTKNSVIDFSVVLTGKDLLL